MPARLLTGGRLTLGLGLACVAGGTFAIPAIAARYRRVPTAPLKVIAIYCLLGLVQSAYLIALSLKGTSNLWVIHLFVPVQGAMFLWALSLWQIRERERVTVVMSIPLFLAVWAGLTVSVESLDALPKYVKVVEGLLVVGVAAFTLVMRSQNITGPVTAYPWFWVASAMVMYLAFGAIITPVANLLMPHAPDLVVRMYWVNSILLIACNLLFARAMFAASVGSSLPDGLRPRSH